MTKLARPLFLGFVLLFSASQVAAKAVTGDSGYYTAKDKEYYLTADEIYFIRPGLVLKIVDFTIPDDLQPVVTFSIKDPGGLPLDIDGVSTPGDVSVRYTLTHIPQGEEQKVSYHADTRDRDGVLTSLGNGMYSYKFNTVLPMNYDQDATHTLALAARRNLRDYGLDRYASNDVYIFVPSGASAPVPREVVTVDTCNRCHDPLAAHGSRYIDTQVCTQCHNPALVEDGVSYSFNVMIHRIHEEADEADTYPAPLNDCETCHTGGTPTDDYPLVANPSSALKCDPTNKKGQTVFTWKYPTTVQIRLDSPDGKLFGGGTEGTKPAGWVTNGKNFFVIEKATGEVLQKLKVNTTLLGCQGDAPGTFRGKAGLQHTNWLERPTRAICGSCHKDVNFDTGEGHSQFEFPVDNDEICTFCHRGYTGEEFDSSIWGAHLEPYKSGQLPNLAVVFIDVMNTKPGDTPTVIFDVYNKFGRVDPNTLDRLRFAITGPNEDFSFYVREDDVAGNSAPMNGYWAYTFETPLPLDASGSFTVSNEGRNEVIIEDYDPEDEIRDALQATLFAFPIDDGAMLQRADFTKPVTDADAVTPRRLVVKDYNCEDCHTNLSGHGGGRTNVQYCNTCHSPDFVSELEPQESVHMKYMTHKIHRGERLEFGYTITRSRGRISAFGDKRYPGDLRNCAKCHVDGSYKLPLPEGVLATTTPQELLPETLPIGATCLSCHDGLDAKTHTVANTTFFGESCGACHADGAAFSVDKVHAR